MSDRLGAALALARAGFRVFPLVPATKLPAVRGWRASATDCERSIRRWWGRHPSHNIGINLERSGCLAIDIDPRNGGLETWAAIARQLPEEPPIPEPFAVQTSGRGDGGRHLIYRVGDLTGLRVAASLGPGVDVKYRGYVVGAGSVHPESGGLYTIDYGSGLQEGVLEPGEGGLAGLVYRAAAGERPVPQGEPVGEGTWADILDALPHIPADERRVWLYTAMALKSTGHPEAFRVFVEWSARSEKFEGEDDCERLWDGIV